MTPITPEADDDLRDDAPDGDAVASPNGENQVRPPRVVGGVAALISAQLGLNPFWVRLTFVVLTLLGGLGIVLYVGLWLVLVVGADDHRRVVRPLGGAVIVLGTLLALRGHRTHFVSGPAAIVLLLVGLAVALWQPRSRSSVAATPLGGAVTVDPQAPTTPRRPMSILGPSFLGLAVVTAAVGALIDQANGGRLHPEQWLGAAAAVCGLGLLIGIGWGRARWLIVPVVLFAASGYVGGVASARGIRIQDTGSRYIDGTDRSGRTSVSFGDVDLSVYQPIPAPEQQDLAVLVGHAHIYVEESAKASIDLTWQIDHGSASIDGVRQPSTGTVHLGPAGAADLVVHVSIWRGDLTVENHVTPAAEASGEDGTADGSIPDVTDPSSDAVVVTPGVSMTHDGSFVLGQGEAIIDNTDHVTLGSSTIRADGVTEINTSYGLFELLPRGLLVTPTNEIIDMRQRRADLTAVTTTTQPGTTTTTNASTPDTTTGS
ncbi:MAG: PspC domain protein [Ilumatobacteraceae bacterium]|nr:PspC domain protein [Ilumatobacteraceae bacterium]